ncbi:hypothetical protein [Calidifontibacillus erzurumensis]|uniref:Uncharacterized protein n=1 Tax=Calidifontibacillus erzurumensis TaxID=2741433 RepID=A0A8J8KC37_9BACI|nr:hypothetical protein [Calidifontibacillus erzurumensis]NSL52222.1 hypothetical protein [Calidifontibacillus erzurumensis]
METEIEKIRETLSAYSNRQVVLNYYEDEELVQRDGLNFDKIIVTEKEIQFISNNKVKASIDLSLYKTFEVSNDFFKNYFALKNRENTLAIYFP